MNNKANIKYASKVVSLIPVNQKYKNRIKEDIINRLEEFHGVEDPVSILGEPENVAKEFIENIDPSELKPMQSTRRRSSIHYSYRSDKTFMGLPIIDIQLGSFKLAKGVIAIGDFAVGLVAIGAVSAGLISIGALGLGVAALGGAAISLICSLGGLAVSGLFSFGGIAVAYSVAVGGAAFAHTLAIGGYASATDIAMGDIAHGKLALFKKDYKGDIGIEYFSTSLELFKAQVAELYPNLPNWLKSVIDFSYDTIMLTSRSN